MRNVAGLGAHSVDEGEMFRCLLHQEPEILLILTHGLLGKKILHTKTRGKQGTTRRNPQSWLSVSVLS